MNRLGQVLPNSESPRIMENPAASRKLRLISGTIPGKYFGRQSPTHESELLM